MFVCSFVCLSECNRLARIKCDDNEHRAALREPLTGREVPGAQPTDLPSSGDPLLNEPWKNTPDKTGIASTGGQQTPHHCATGEEVYHHCLQAAYSDKRGKSVVMNITESRKGRVILRDNWL
jgi:hypothetical protein